MMHRTCALPGAAHGGDHWAWGLFPAPARGPLAYYFKSPVIPNRASRALAEPPSTATNRGLKHIGTFCDA